MWQDSLTLSFKFFQSHISTTIDESFIFSNFTDVTLVSDDDKHIPAHKLVLSACSPVLSKLFLSHPNHEPFIYFQSVKHEQLKALLDFIYLGRVSINQDMLEDLLEFAEDLQITGLVCEDFNGTIEYATDFDQYDVQNDIKYTILSEKIQFGDEQKETKKSNLKNNIDEPETKHTSEMNMNRNIGHIVKGRPIYSCEECDYSAPKSKVKRHVESKHRGIRYSCDKCDVEFTSVGQLNTHNKIKHEGEKVKHEGIRHICDQCNYQATRLGYLKNHKSTTHNNSEITVKEV